MQLFFIDPQSYNNLSVYDTSLLSAIEGCDTRYYHNVKYQCERLPQVDYRGVFRYSDLSGLAKAASYTMSIVRIALDAIRHRPQVAHVQWFRLFQVDCVFVMLLRLLGVKIVYTAHNVMPHNPRKSDRKHYAWYYRHADEIIVHTQRSKDELMRDFAIPAEKIHVVFHGIMPSTTDSEAVAARTKELRALLGVDGRKLVFASMGYQNRYKGIDIIAEVWSREEFRCNPDIMLLVVGKVEDADITGLRKYQNVVVVDKMTSDVDFAAYMLMADVVLLPYRRISQSGVLLTALGREIPVVVSDVGGLPEPLSIAEVGWNIGAPTAENLAQTMTMLVKNPQIAIGTKHNRRAFAAVKDAYSWSSIGCKTLQIYRKSIL